MQIFIEEQNLGSENCATYSLHDDDIDQSKTDQDQDDSDDNNNKFEQFANKPVSE